MVPGPSVEPPLFVCIHNIQKRIPHFKVGVTLFYSACNSYVSLDCTQENDDHLGNAVWIGARRKNINDCSSPLEWISNVGATFPIKYSNWAPGEPSCGKQKEACASINEHFGTITWNDLECTWYTCPLCEVTIYA